MVMLSHKKIIDGRIVDGENGEGNILIYINPTDIEKRYLLDTLKFDEHTLQSALDPNELSRIEFEPEHLALIIKRPKRYTSQDNFLFHVLSLGVFIFADKLVIVMSDDTQLFSDRKMPRMNSILDVVLRLVYSSIFHFEEHLRVINMCSEELEGKINTAMENKQLLNMFTLEKSLVYYLNAISSNGRVIERLKFSATKIGFSTENIEFIEDISIENTQCYEQAQIYSQVLSGLMDARVSVVSNNLNLLMKSLTIVMICLMIPTLWTSFFSMNLPVPGQHAPIMFWMVVGSAVLMMGMVYLVSRWRKW